MLEISFPWLILASVFAGLAALTLLFLYGSKSSSTKKEREETRSALQIKTDNAAHQFAMRILFAIAASISVLCFAGYAVVSWLSGS